jgi:hypothetical protein
LTLSRSDDDDDIREVVTGFNVEGATRRNPKKHVTGISKKDPLSLDESPAERSGNSASASRSRERVPHAHSGKRPDVSPKPKERPPGMFDKKTGAEERVQATLEGRPYNYAKSAAGTKSRKADEASVPVVPRTAISSGRPIGHGRPIQQPIPPVTPTTTVVGGSSSRKVAVSQVPATMTSQSIVVHSKTPSSSSNVSGSGGAQVIDWPIQDASRGTTVKSKKSTQARSASSEDRQKKKEPGARNA